MWQRGDKLAVILSHLTKIYEIKGEKSIQGFYPNKDIKIVSFNYFDSLQKKKHITIYDEGSLISMLV